MANTSMDIKTCPQCGNNCAERVCADWRGEANGRSYVVPQLTYVHCPDCGESVYPPEAMRQIERHSPTYKGKMRA